NTLAHAASPWLAPVEEVGDTEVAHALAPDAAIREVLIPSSYPVAGVALSIRQDTRRRDRGTGQLEAGSGTDTLATLPFPARQAARRRRPKGRAWVRGWGRRGRLTG